MSVVPDKSSVILRSPAHLAAAVPGLVGFTPEQSLVVVYLRGGLVALTMRLDLPGNFASAAEHVVETGARVHADEVVLIVCCPRGAGLLPHQTELAVVTHTCEAAGLAVMDALLVDTGRFWSYLCTRPSCCPPDGAVIPADASGLIAEAVGSGRLAPASTRAELVERFQARPDLAPRQDARDHAAALDSLPLTKRAEQVWAAVEQLAASGGADDGTDDRLRAVVQVGIQAIHVRDYVLTRVALSEANSAALVDVVVHCALTAPDELRPRVAGAAAALLASCQGSSIAVEAVLEHAAGESIAELVAISVRRAVPPDLLRDTFVQAHSMVLAHLAQDTP